MAAVTVAVRNEANTSTTSTLTTAFNIWWQAQVNAPGLGGFELKSTDAAVDTISDGSVVLFSLGVTARMAARVTNRDYVEVDSGDEHVEAVRFSCTGLAVDLWETWVQPISGYADFVPSLDRRIWGWFAPGYSVSSWDASNELAAQGWASAFYTGQPAGFTDAGAFWIWSDDGTTSDAPAGSCLFVDEVEVSAGAKFLEWGCDNTGVLWINGDEMAQSSDRRSRSQVRFTTTSGTLRIAAKITNAADDGPPGGNPGGWVASLRSGSPTGTVIWKTTDAVKVLAYPSSDPEIPVGEILRDVWPDELGAQWTLIGTDSLDTNAVSWPTLSQFEVRTYEDSVGEMFDTLAQEYMDWTFDATGKTVRPYVKDTLGDAVTLALVTGYSTAGQADPGDVNVLDLAWDVRRAEATTVAVRWRDGWRVRGSGGRPKKAVRAEQLASATAADQFGDALVTLYGSEQKSAQFNYLPLTEPADLPYSAFELHDEWPLPAPGDQDSTVNQKVWSFTISGGLKSDTADRGAGGGIEVEVGDPVRDRIERLELAARRGISSLGGLASGATRRGAQVTEQVSIATVAGPSETTVRVVSDPFPEERSVTANNAFVGWVTSLRLEGTTDGGTSTYDITAGASTYTLSGTGSGVIDVVSVGAYWDTTTSLTIECTAVGHTNVQILAEIGAGQWPR